MRRVEAVHAHEERFRCFRAAQNRRAYFARDCFAIRRDRILEIKYQRVRGGLERFRDLALVVTGDEKKRTHAYLTPSSRGRQAVAIPWRTEPSVSGLLRRLRSSQ